MSKTGIALSTLRRESLSLFRSNVYSIIIFADAIMSMLVAYNIFYGTSNYSNLVFQIILAIFVYKYYSFFIIFLLAPSLSISEEKETGTWDMINSQIKDNTGVVLGKIYFQLLFSTTLVLVSIIAMSAVYFIIYGSFAAHTTIVVTTISRTLFSTPFSHVIETRNAVTNHIIGTSPVSIFEIILIYMMASAVLTLIGMGFSRVSKNRIVSILFIVVFFIAISGGLLSTISGRDSSALANLYGYLLSFNPQTLFSMAGVVTGLSNLTVVTGSNIMIITITKPISGLAGYAFYYVIMTVTFLAIIFAPVKEEIVSWIRK